MDGTCRGKVEEERNLGYTVKLLLSGHLRELPKVSS